MEGVDGRYDIIFDNGPIHSEEEACEAIGTCGFVLQDLLNGV